MHKHLGFLFNLIAIALFIPGILLPMFSLTMDLSANVGTSQLATNLVSKELSLLGTIKELWHDQRHFVAVLIFLFSIAIPIIKATLMTLAYAKKESQLEGKIISLVSKIGKWSMADVFVVAVFLAILSTNHAQTAEHHQVQLFAFKLDLSLSSETLSSAGQGFYYFSAYCLLSLLGNTLYSIKHQVK